MGTLVDLTAVRLNPAVGHLTPAQWATYGADLDACREVVARSAGGEDAEVDYNDEIEPGPDELATLEMAERDYGDLLVRIPCAPAHMMRYNACRAAARLVIPRRDAARNHGKRSVRAFSIL